MDTRTTYGEIEETIDEVETRFNKFSNFDSIDHPPYDHKYYSLVSLKTNKGSTKARMERELSSLKENIPDWIFVRSYKHRIDLMRAAIIGPPNTPYNHCLFFFDIELPQNYPSKPPKVHYLSRGIDLNPNLCADGRVTLVALSEAKWDCCLSVNKGGKWDPEESNLLHVFHGIRDTLRRKLEPKGYRRVFVATCEMMIKVMREPPAGFRDFVLGYFRKMSHGVLMKFREGEYYDSMGVDLFVKMFKVFERNGSYCKHHIRFLREAVFAGACEGLDLKAIIRELQNTNLMGEDQEHGEPERSNAGLWL